LIWDWVSLLTLPYCYTSCLATSNRALDVDNPLPKLFEQVKDILNLYVPLCQIKRQNTLDYFKFCLFPMITDNNETRACIAWSEVCILLIWFTWLRLIVSRPLHLGLPTTWH